MKRKFKFISYIILLVLIFIPYSVKAASGSYSISSNSNVTIDDTISVTFTIKGTKIFYWQAYISYDSSRLQLVSGSTLMQGESENINGQGTITQTLKFKAKKTGSAYVAISMGDKGLNINSSTEEVSYSKKTKNITINEKKVVTYSSNNYLKSLEVENYKITPNFNKDTKEYSLEVPADTKKIKINATKEDNKASINGIGEKEVTEGINKFLIKVTAENGNTREYTLNVTVKELEPINLTIDNKEYSVIRKTEQLPPLNSTVYEKTTIKINSNDVPALKSEITGYTLVGLKDKDGKSNLFIYNEKENTYSLYKEFSFNKLTLYPIDKDLDIPNGFEESTLQLNETEIKAYKNIKNPHYYIFKAINIETGEENIYIYDSKENTVQRYTSFDGKIQSVDSNSNLYLYACILLGSILILTYIIILINLINKNKKPTKLSIKHKK